MTAAAEQSVSILRDRVLLFVALAASWEAVGRLYDPTWFSAPSLVAARLAQWAAADLGVHVLTTVAEMALGIAIGVPVGIIVGLVLGRAPVASGLLRPLIVTLYSVPLVTLAPLFILWFGLDMKPKVIQISVVVFFLMFFNTYSGVQAIDRDLVATIELMGAKRTELFRKLIAPAALPWIFSGLKIALPYALIAATVGEMIAGRQGMGVLITRSASQIDMTGIYAALVVLMLLGVAIGEGAARLESHLLRWRESGR